MENQLPYTTQNYKHTTTFNGCLRTGLISGFVGGFIKFVNMAPHAANTDTGRSIILLWKNCPVASFGVGALVYFVSRVAIHLLTDPTKNQPKSRRDLTELTVHVITSVVTNLTVAMLTIGGEGAIVSSIPAGIVLGLITWLAVKISTKILQNFKFENKKETNWGYWAGSEVALNLLIQKNPTSTQCITIKKLETKYENGKVLAKVDKKTVRGWFDITHHPVCIRNKKEILSHIFKGNIDDKEKNRLMKIWQNISSRPLFEF